MEETWTAITCSAPQPIRSECVIVGDFDSYGCVILRNTNPMPNRWRRFWQWALLGWRWRSMEA